jgi:hypothetical protein
MARPCRERAAAIAAIVMPIVRLISGVRTVNA